MLQVRLLLWRLCGSGAAVLVEQLLGGVVLCGFLELGDGIVALFVQVVEVGLAGSEAIVEEGVKGGSDSIDEEG